MDKNGTLTPESTIIQKLNLSQEISNNEINLIINSNDITTNSINENFVENSISYDKSNKIQESEVLNSKKVNNSQILKNNAFANNITYTSNLNDFIININYTNIINPDSTIFNTPTNFIKENSQFINNSTNNTSHNITNGTTHVQNENKFKNISKKILDNLDPKFILALEIFLPLIILIIIIVCILCCIKRKIKIKMQENINNENNGIKFQNIVNSKPYNRIQNTSGFNVGLNPNNYSMSEIKVQNLKDEIHKIINNNSGSSSSGKRKREKRKTGNNNNINLSSQENNKGIQNEIQEEIKKYVIDEHINNS